MLIYRWRGEIDPLGFPQMLAEMGTLLEEDAMAEKKQKTPSSEARSKASKPPTPTVTIYQNADHVSGVLQQLYRQPLVKADTMKTPARRSAPVIAA